MKIPHSEFLLTDEDWMFERLERWIIVLRAALHGARQPLQVEISRVRSEVERPFSAPKNFEPIAIGAEWGQTWDYAWLRFIGTIPADWKGQPVDALIDLEGEVSVFTLSGEITRRLTWGSAFGVPCQVEDIALTPACDGGEPITVLVQAWASSIVGVDQPADPLPDDPLKDGLHRARIKTAHLAVARPEARRLLWDAEVVLGLAREMPAFSARRAKALQALMDACILWQDNPERSMVARARLQPELARPATSSSVEAVAVGHAHIDTGWLWRVDDSIGKCARTFASQMELIEKYPTYRFGASSAQHYAFVKEHHPDLHRRIQAAVKAGRWELQGGMWIEPDTNLPSGEALIRQLLYGQQFFRREFGQECTVAWLPDVFGLSAALPQILARSGIRYLLTKKPHWGRTNRYPDTAFRWAGHDGSEIIAHLLPQARDYNGLMRVQDMVAAERGFAEKARFDRFVYTVGIGDGGGGPSELHVERALRLASLEGVPRVRFGASDEVFAQFEAGRDQLKRRRGDLYVEGHRGTYTTQARLKRDNRKLEILLGQIEQLYCYLPTVQYPGQHFARLWQTVLLHQFHDILPGSGIRRVIEDAEAGNTQVYAELADLQTRFADGLPARAGTLSLLNTLGHPWTGLVTSDSLLVRADGRPAGSAQREPDGRVITQVTLPALCFTPLVASAVAAEPVRPLLEPVLENEHLRCAFNAAGELVSVFDKHAGRECFAPGAPGNRLSLYVDRPIDWDAWDIDPLYRQECVATAESAGPWLGWAGPARSVLVFTLRIGGSTLTQRCVLAADARRVDFETEVVWSERHKMLRVGFAYPGLGTVSRCEIQHGFFDRPTHQNTSYEQACFEVPCHRYACLLGQDGGLAVLNDSKYGVRIEENLVELALLRSSTHPDHSADLGTHRFTYAYRPLATKAEALDLPAEAACLNVAPLRLDGKDASTLTPPVALTAKGVAVDAIKRAEDGSALVLRLVNVSGEGGSVTLPEGERWRAADMMERPLTPTAPIEGAVSLRPFEVVTLLRDVG